MTPADDSLQFFCEPRHSFSSYVCMWFSMGWSTPFSSCWPMDRLHEKTASVRKNIYLVTIFHGKYNINSVSSILWCFRTKLCDYLHSMCWPYRKYQSVSLTCKVVSSSSLSWVALSMNWVRFDIFWEDRDANNLKYRIENELYNDILHL